MLKIIGNLHPTSLSTRLESFVDRIKDKSRYLESYGSHLEFMSADSYVRSSSKEE